MDKKDFKKQVVDIMNSAEGKDEVEVGKLSDGDHTFDDLYYHRMMLFSIICNTYQQYAWKSWHHDDGTMYDDYFIVGVTTPEGDYSYHYHKDYWDQFDVPEKETAPPYDGHKPEDIGRLTSLLGLPTRYNELVWPSKPSIDEMVAAHESDLNPETVKWINDFRKGQTAGE